VAGAGFELRFGGGGSGREIGCCAVRRNSAGASLGGVDVAVDGVGLDGDGFNGCWVGGA